MHDNIYEDLIRKKLLNPRQHGSRSREGSEEALTIMIKYWKEVVTKAVDEFDEFISGCNVLFFDLAKAFDRVWKKGYYINLEERSAWSYIQWKSK